MSTVMGVDLSLTSTGIAWVGAGSVVGVNRVTSKGEKGASVWEREQRLSDIATTVIGFAIDGEPDLVVVEAPSYGSVTGSQHDRSGLWWLVVQGLIEVTDGKVATVTPTARAKYATGKGTADKRTVFAAVLETYGDAVRDVAAIGFNRGNDMADAVVLAAMGSRHLGLPVEASLTAKHLEAMAKAEWPS